MEIVCHIGANCTDEDRLLRSLLRNTGVLAKDGVRVPGPGKYRRLLRETIQGLKGAPPPPNSREVLLDAILDDDRTERLVLSNSNFICIPNRIFENGTFYLLAEPKLRGLRALFPGDEIELYLAIRNPATFIPETFQASKFDDLPTFMRGLHPTEVRWSDLVRRIRQLVPDAKLTVWCNEDTPLLWGRLMRAITGVLPSVPLVGTYDLLKTIMADEGMQRMQAYMTQNPPPTQQHELKIIMAFLDKYAIEDLLEEELDLPEFTQDLVEDLTDRYDNDVDAIAAMPDVIFLDP
ncbi:MAG: hypothetical protein AAFQ64_20895 [Pseudomonadota bacterium]